MGALTISDSLLERMYCPRLTITDFEPKDEFNLIHSMRKDCRRSLRRGIFYCDSLVNPISQ